MCINIIPYFSFAKDSTSSEIRFGFFKHDVKWFDQPSWLGKRRYEKGYDFNLEYLGSPLPIKYQNIVNLRPHVGCNVNNQGGTNQFYIGLALQLPIQKYFFIESSLGGEIHDGNLKHAGKKKHLGSRLLFRESLTLGLQTDTFTTGLTINHASNANLAQPNSGITGIGLLIGYRF